MPDDDHPRPDPAAAMWDGADYDLMASLLRPAAEALAAAAREAPGGPVLDLAAGTGSTTVALGRDGRHVDAVDLAPGLVRLGRERCRSLGLDTTWHVGRLEELDRIDGLAREYAAAVSSFGMIFAPDPVTALRGVAQRLQPGGHLLLATWDRDGYVADMSRAMAETLPEDQRGVVTSWIRWGAEAAVRDWLTEAGLSEVAATSATLPWRFPSAHAAVEFLFSASPGHVAGARAAADGGDRLRTTVLDHLVDWAGLRSGADEVDIEAGYLVVSGRAVGHRPA